MIPRTSTKKNPPSAAARRLRSRATVAALLAGALSGTGCSLVPRYERPASPVANRFPGEPEKGPGALASEIAWASFCADEQLRRLVAVALESNRDLRIATLRVEQYQAQYRVTRSSSFPAVTAGGSYSRQRAAGVTSSQWAASVGATAYELDFFGRVRALNEQALETYLASEEARKTQQITLVSEVTIQYLALRHAEAQLQLAKDTLATMQESLRINQALFDAGAVNELDVRSAEGQVQSASVSVISSERQLAQAEDALVLLLGQPLPSDGSVTLPFPEATLLAEVPAGLPSDLLERRPDILQAEHTLKAANARIGAARAAFFPTISLTASAGTASTELTGLLGGGSGNWSFVPQISVPIFDGGQNQANLDATRIATRIEVATYEKTIQTAFREVADALVGVRTYGDEIEAERKAIIAQQRRLEVATARYRQGEDAYLNVLSAQRDLYSAQQGLLQAQLDRLSSQVSLYKALGGGWQ